jgi:O-antigen ligase
MYRTLRFSENLFAAISLFFFSGALVSVLIGLPSELNPDPDSALMRSIFLLIYLVTLLLLILRWEKTLKRLRKHQWIFFLVILALVSTLWSSVPDITFRKSIALTGSTLFAVYFGAHYDFDRQLKVLGWMFGFSMILSVMFVALLPTYGLMDTAGKAWRGIYTHKNGFGENLFITFTTFYFLSKRVKKYRFMFKLVCVFSAILIYLANSATSLISMVFIYVAAKVLGYSSLRSRSSVFLTLVFLLLGFLISLILTTNFNAFLEANNRDVTLTGRIPLWETLWEFIKMKFWFGYGYGAFFSGLHTETQLLWRVHSWKPPHAHNGLVRILLDLGFVGFSIFVLGYFYNVGKSLWLYLIKKDIKLLWTFSLLLYAIIFNFSEVSFLSINQLNWILSLVSIYSLSSEVGVSRNVEK